MNQNVILLLEIFDICMLVLLVYLLKLYRDKISEWWEYED